MAETLKPQLDILPNPQRALWQELVDTPEEFVLYGGTAIALQLGHRVSVDFDFFSNKKIEPQALLNDIPYLKKAHILQSKPSTLTVSVNRNGPVKISFFGVPKIPRLSPPLVVEDIGIKIAPLLDLAGLKVSVVQSRAEAKDYLDIDAILTSGRIDLPTALAAGKVIYGHTFSPESALKALCYFDDGNVNTIPEEAKKRLVNAATSVNLDNLPIIKQQSPLSVESKKP